LGQNQAQHRKQSSPNQTFSEGSTNQTSIQNWAQSNQTFNQSPASANQAPPQNQALPNQTATQHQAVVNQVTAQNSTENRAAPLQGQPAQTRGFNGPTNSFTNTMDKTPQSSVIRQNNTGLGAPTPNSRFYNAGRPKALQRDFNSQNTIVTSADVSTASQGMISQDFASQTNTAEGFTKADSISQNITSRNALSHRPASQGATSQHSMAQSVTSQGASASRVPTSCVMPRGSTTGSMTSQGHTSQECSSTVITSQNAASQDVTSETVLSTTSSPTQSGKSRSDSSASKNSFHSDENWDEPGTNNNEHETNLYEDQSPDSINNSDKKNNNSSKDKTKVQVFNQVQSNKPRSPAQSRKKPLKEMNSSKGGAKFKDSASPGKYLTEKKSKQFTPGGTETGTETSKMASTSETNARSFSGKGGKTFPKQNLEAGRASFANTKKLQILKWKLIDQGGVLSCRGEELPQQVEMYKTREKLELMLK
jgi:hypothetical protein